MLTGFLRNRRMQKLLEELEASPRPRPEAFVELVQMYREDGDFQAASRIAKRGAEVYPDSERILASRADMEQVTRDLEKERLRQKIESYPNPILYARLAELYKADGQIEASIRVCHTGISTFPVYGGTYLVLGEICMENGDYQGARVHLEKAADLDKYNYTALKLLAQVYMKLGAADLAARRLEAILYFAPGDESIVEMLRQAREAAGEPPPTEVPVAAEVLESPDEAADEQADEPEAYVEMEAVPEEGYEREEGYRGAGGGGDGAEIGREVEINAAVHAITGISGVKGALLVDAYGLVIAAKLGEDVEEDLAGAMITNIYRGVARSAEPMGIGTFEDGLIEGEGGNIHVMGVEDMILAVFADETVKMGMLEKTLRDFVDKVLD
jgi:predicted regulator of Ras-like GTPase activity (Roadblock/LC7/MglB family)